MALEMTQAESTSTPLRFAFAAQAMPHFTPVPAMPADGEVVS